SRNSGRQGSLFQPHRARKGPRTGMGFRATMRVNVMGSTNDARKGSIGDFHGAGGSDTASKRPLVRSSLMTREIARMGLFSVETAASGPKVPAKPKLASKSS